MDTMNNQLDNPFIFFQNNIFLKISLIITVITQISGFLLKFNTILKTILLLANYKNYTIHTIESKNKIIKEIKNFYCYNYTENFEPMKTIVDKNNWIPEYFIDGISDDKYESIRIFCTKDTLKRLLKNDTDEKKKEIKLDSNYLPIKGNDTYSYDSDDSDSDYESDHTDELGNKINKFTYITLNAMYGQNTCNSRKLQLSNIGPTTFLDYQEEAFKQIMKFYKDNHFCKVFINGPPGKGKTYFSYLIANKLNSYLTDTYSPSDPGSSFSAIYNRHKINIIKPLIVVLDEVDILLDNIHNNKLVFHKHYKREICDKVTWNNFFDKIEYGLFPNTIFILTSNKPKYDLDKLDKSYLRDGRINLNFNWN